MYSHVLWADPIKRPVVTLSSVFGDRVNRSEEQYPVQRLVIL